MDGKARWLERHVRRLQRDAKALRLGDVPTEAVTAAFEALAAAVFPDRDGIVRLQASRDGTGMLHLVGIPRETGPEPDRWDAVVAPFAHEGPTPVRGAKVSNRLIHTLAREACRSAGAHEAILCDHAGRVIEGAGCNLFAVFDDGELAAPALEQGAVAGLAQEVVREQVPDLVDREVWRAEVPALRELIAVNAVRGARPIVRVDGQPIGGGQPGPWAEKLDALLARA